MVGLRCTAGDGRDVSKASRSVDDGAETILFPPIGAIRYRDVYIRKECAILLDRKDELRTGRFFVLAAPSPISQ
jgi:hypothetical protein